jgi:hypothetical protein
MNAKKRRKTEDTKSFSRKPCYLRKHFRFIAPCIRSMVYVEEDTSPPSPDTPLEEPPIQPIEEEEQHQEMSVFDLLFSAQNRAAKSEIEDTQQELEITVPTTVESDFHKVRCDYVLQYCIVAMYQQQLSEHSEKYYHYMLQSYAMLEINPQHLALRMDVDLCDECFAEYLVLSPDVYKDVSERNKTSIMVALRPLQFEKPSKRQFTSIFVYKFDTLTSLFWDLYHSDQLQSASVMLLHMIYLSDRMLYSFHLSQSTRALSGDAALRIDRFEKVENLLLGVMALYRRSKNIDLMGFFNEHFLKYMVKKVRSCDCMY